MNLTFLVLAHCWGGAHQFRHSLRLLPAVLLGLMVLVAGAVQSDGNSTVPNGSTAPTAPAAGRETIPRGDCYCGVSPDHSEVGCHAGRMG